MEDSLNTSTATGLTLEPMATPTVSDSRNTTEKNITPFITPIIITGSSKTTTKKKNKEDSLNTSTATGLTLEPMATPTVSDSRNTTEKNITPFITPIIIAGSSKTTTKKKTKGNKNCCVPHCVRAGYVVEDGKKVTFHRFPKDPKLRQEWIIKVKRDLSEKYEIKDHTFVCSRHFTEADLEFNPYNQRRFIRQGAVPSVFECWKNIPHISTKRISRPPNRRQLFSALTEPPESDSITEDLSNSNFEMPTLDPLEELKLTVEKLKLENSNLKSANSELQNMIKIDTFSIDNIKGSEFLFYTGFPSSDVFYAVLKYLDPGDRGENIIYSSHMSRITGCKLGRPRKLTPANEFFLFLCRVRLGLFEQDLAKRFKISVSTVSDIIITWANFIYMKLGTLTIWASKASVKKFMPESFKTKYPHTRVIIDATEIKLEMPSSLVLKSESYSNYKSSNTLKGLIGISPSGCLTFVSQLYTGSISDREITIRSGLLSLPFEWGDVVMADKGFDIQDLLDPLGVKLNIPPFLGMNSQMPASDVHETQAIAAERIHVERLINKIKNFHIFDSVIPLTLAGSINQLWSSCALLTLFQNPIISQEINKA